MAWSLFFQSVENGELARPKIFTLNFGDLHFTFSMNMATFTNSLKNTLFWSLCCSAVANNNQASMLLCLVEITGEGVSVHDRE